MNLFRRFLQNDAMSHINRNVAENWVFAAFIFLIATFLCFPRNSVSRTSFPLFFLFFFLQNSFFFYFISSFNTSLFFSPSSLSLFSLSPHTVTTTWLRRTPSRRHHPHAAALLNAADLPLLYTASCLATTLIQPSHRSSLA